MKDKIAISEMCDTELCSIKKKRQNEKIEKTWNCYNFRIINTVPSNAVFNKNYAIRKCVNNRKKCSVYPNNYD